MNYGSSWLNTAHGWDGQVRQSTTSAGTTSRLLVLRGLLPVMGVPVVTWGGRNLFQTVERERERWQIIIVPATSTDDFYLNIHCNFQSINIHNTEEELPVFAFSSSFLSSFYQSNLLPYHYFTSLRKGHQWDCIVDVVIEMDDFVLFVLNASETFFWPNYICKKPCKPLIQFSCLQWLSGRRRPSTLL